MCHSENKYGDKQNKNRLELQNCALKIYYGRNRKTLGALKTVTTLGKHIWQYTKVRQDRIVSFIPQMGGRHV